MNGDLKYLRAYKDMVFVVSTLDKDELIIYSTNRSQIKAFMEPEIVDIGFNSTFFLIAGKYSINVYTWAME